MSDIFNLFRGLVIVVGTIMGIVIVLGAALFVVALIPVVGPIIFVFVGGTITIAILLGLFGLLTGGGPIYQSHFQSLQNRVDTLQKSVDANRRTR